MEINCAPCSLPHAPCDRRHAMSNPENNLPIAAPNYTQTPNAIYDLLPAMGEAELRVTLAVVRETFGWHRQEAPLSLADLERLTGLSRQGVINGVQAAIGRGVVVRRLVERQYRYALNVAADRQPGDPSGGLRSRPGVVNAVDPSLYKEDSKEKERNAAPGTDPETGVYGPHPPTPSPQVERGSQATRDSRTGARGEVDLAEIKAAYERWIGPLTPLLLVQLREAAARTPHPWLIEALELTQRRYVEGVCRKPSLDYALGIIRRWDEDGYDGAAEDLEQVKAEVDRIVRGISNH